MKSSNIETLWGIATLKGFEGLLANAISAIMGLAAIVLFFMLISGGFSYLTSSGDPKAVESASKTISSAIGGIVILILSLLILKIIEKFTGVTLTTFKVFLK